MRSVTRIAIIAILPLCSPSKSQNSIRSIDSILNEIISQEKSRGVQTERNFDRVLRDESAHQLLIAKIAALQQAAFIGLVNKNGILVNSTQQSLSPEIDVSNSPHFQFFEKNDVKDIYISNAQVDRLKGIPVVFFSKRISGTNNEFLGVVVVGVKLTYFQHIYESIASLRNLSVLFLHRNGTVIVRYPDPKTRVGEKMPAESPWYQLVSQGGGEYRSPGYFDGETRLIAVHPLRDYPIVVNIGASETAALATWRIQATTIAIGTLLVMFCLAFLLKALSAQFRRLAISEATLEQANTKIDAALNNMSQGLVMFDLSNRLVVCNQRYLEMYDLSPEIVRPGTTLREILKHRVASGHFFSDDPEQYMTDIVATAARGENFNKLTSLRDGRIISIVNHPTVDGGWVATHEDVTEQKRAEERITYAAHIDALTGLPNRKLFYEQLEQALKRVRRGERLAVLIPRR